MFDHSRFEAGDEYVGYDLETVLPTPTEAWLDAAAALDVSCPANGWPADELGIPDEPLEPEWVDSGEVGLSVAELVAAAAAGRPGLGTVALLARLDPDRLSCDARI
jgi:hypothetical protein